MEKNLYRILLLLFTGLLIVLTNEGCSRKEPEIKFPLGTFPDSLFNLNDINTIYDDYNSTLLQINGQLPIIFSSNRGSRGGQFDLVAGNIWYKFDQTTGEFDLGSEMNTDQYLSALVTKASTPLNDFGPNRLFNSTDGFEYLITASQNLSGNLDLYYMKYLPQLGTSVPSFPSPIKINIFSSASNDAYFSFDNEKRTAYFTSDREGNWNIYSHSRPVSTNLDTWFNTNFTNSVLVDSINTSSDDKCPYIYNNLMIFSSDRPGGMGGYDLYYSIYKGGKWNTPVNLGPEINTSSDEFRPIIGSQGDFKNVFIIFSSNRPGGKGGFDLYFTGFEIPYF